MKSGESMKRTMRIKVAMWYVVCIIIIVLGVSGGIWFSFFMPCRYFDYLPGSHVPARCLELRK